MQSLIIKIIGIPLLLILANYAWKSVYIGGLMPYLIFIIILSPLAVLLEYIFLPRISYGKTLLIDFIFFFVFIYGIGLLLPSVEITIWGTILTSILLTLMEAMVHKHLMADHMTHSYH